MLVITSFQNALENLDWVRGRKDPLTVTRRKIYEHLDRTLNFSLIRGVAFSQHDFLEKK